MAGTNDTIAGGGFHHVAIRAKDFDATLKFYTEGLGFRHAFDWGAAPKRAIMLDTGDGNYLEVFERGDENWADSDASILHFALRTDDVNTAIEKARAAGAEVTMEPKDVEVKADPKTVFRIAFCKGPDNEVIEFFQNGVL